MNRHTVKVTTVVDVVDLGSGGATNAIEIGKAISDAANTAATTCGARRPSVAISVDSVMLVTPAPELACLGVPGRVVGSVLAARARALDEQCQALAEIEREFVALLDLAAWIRKLQDRVRRAESAVNSTKQVALDEVVKRIHRSTGWPPAHVREIAEGVYHELGLPL